MKCEVEGCDKRFNKLSGYNTHVVKVHGLLKTSKHYCPICKSVTMSTENQFKLHCRQCNKESEKKDSDHPIECEICKKKCQNLKSYTVHKLFHDTRNLIGASSDKSSSLYSKGPVICEVISWDYVLDQRVVRTFPWSTALRQGFHECARTPDTQEERSSVS